MESCPEFVVAAPPERHSSAGVVALHRLADEIGRHTSCYVAEYTDKFRCPKFPDSIVIYPEKLIGNPLRGRKVVRYLLNKEGALTGKMTVNPGDFVLSYSKTFTEKPDHIIHQCNFDLIGDAGLPWGERKIDAFYVGKGAKYGPCARPEGAIEITRDWPPTKAELYDLLRRVRHFFSWDGLSQTNLDALLCGAYPLILRYDPMTRAELVRYEVPVIVDDESQLEQTRIAAMNAIKCIQAGFSESVVQFIEKARSWQSQTMAN